MTGLYLALIAVATLGNLSRLLFGVGVVVLTFRPVLGASRSISTARRSSSTWAPSIFIPDRIRSTHPCCSTWGCTRRRQARRTDRTASSPRSPWKIRAGRRHRRVLAEISGNPREIGPRCHVVATRARNRPAVSAPASCPSERRWRSVLHRARDALESPIARCFLRTCDALFTTDARIIQTSTRASRVLQSARTAVHRNLARARRAS